MPKGAGCDGRVLDDADERRCCCGQLRRVQCVRLRTVKSRGVAGNFAPRRDHAFGSSLFAERFRHSHSKTEEEKAAGVCVYSEERNINQWCVNVDGSELQQIEFH